MTEIFNNPSKPFYRFGDIMLLPKIESEKWITFICKSFVDSGKQISEADAAWIPKLMKDHSWYVQQLSHYTWNLTAKKATSKEVALALQELIQANTPLYQREVEIISGTQLNLLKAIAKKENQFTSTAIMRDYMLGTPRNVSKNKAILLANDMVYEHNGTLEFLDPAFELWFKKQFFNESYLEQLGL
ncbi:MAG: ATPase [Cytophagaceae bacterium]|nr:ATPase [Cytophagaceae bacterium]